MAVTLVRTGVTPTDDDLTGTVGTAINAAWATALMDAIDVTLALVDPAWVTPTFAAGDFTGNGSLVWTVASGDVVTFAYHIVGKKMTVAFELDTTTLGGTTNFKVFIKIPASKTAAKRMKNPIWINHGGGSGTTGYAQVDAGSTFISLFLTTQGNFTLGTNDAYFNGEIVFEIQ